LLTETDDEKVSKRLIFVKRLYKGATLEDAADDVGMSQSTGSRWAKLWNKGGLGLLAPSFGGGSSSQKSCVNHYRSHAQLILDRLRQFLGYSPPPLLDRLIEDAKKSISSVLFSKNDWLSVSSQELPRWLS